MTPLPRGRGHGGRMLSIGFLAAAAATFVAISPVLADTELARYGKTGVGSINEARGDVVCNYDDATLELTSIDIASPYVYARDRTSAIDFQTVGWQVIVRRGGSNGPRTYRLNVQKALATDGSAAVFSARMFVPGQLGLAGGTHWSVIIKMIWYRPLRAPGSPDASTIVGWSKHRVDFFTYRSPNTGDSYPVNGACDSFLH